MVLPATLMLAVLYRFSTSSMAKEQQGDPQSGSCLLDLALRIEPLRMALWDAGMPCTLCHALHAAWRKDMQPAAAAARWLAARTPGAAGAALPGLMRRVADRGRLDVAAALLASRKGERWQWLLYQWARQGRTELCRLLLTR